MSATGPNVYVTIGDTDYWASQYCSTNITFDARLRAAYRSLNGGSWASIMGSALRSPVAGHGFYAELLVIDSVAGGLAFGVTLSGNESSQLTNHAGAITNSVGRADASIYSSAVEVQTGLTAVADGDIIGLRFYNDSGTLKVQFYLNGAASGTAVSVSAGSWRLVYSNVAVGSHGFLRVDREDLRYLSSMPNGTQPWGSSARIADAGGYSPAASVLDIATRSSAALTLDAFSRVATTSTAAWDSVRSDIALRSGATHSGARFRWVEFQRLSGSAGSFTFGGVHLTSTTLSSFVGSDANGWSFYFHDFDAYHNGTSTPYTGSAVPAADRIGVCLDTYTGKIWFAQIVQSGTTWTTTIIGGGNPESGTSATYSNVSGTVAPALSVNTAGGATVYARLYTHAREQVGRPSYATAWDGSDLLPEQHYKGLLGNDPYIEQGIWFPIPWGGGDRSGSPIGAIEVLNNDGAYDALSDYSLRNQRVAVDRVWPNESTPEAEARGVVSSVEIDGEANLRVLTDSILSKLDTRIDYPAFALGEPFVIPVEAISTSSLTYSMGFPPFWWPAGFNSGGGIMDNGVVVSSFRQRGSSTFAGFVRTVAPAGKQAVRGLVLFGIDATQTGSFTNGEFTAWTGDNPDGWTVTETAPSDIVTQSGSACRLIRAAGGPTVSIAQTLSAGERFIKIVVSAYTSGRLQVTGSTSGTIDVDVGGTGTYYVYHNGTTVTIAATNDTATDITIDSVSPLSGYSMVNDVNAATFLLEYMGGLSSSEWTSGGLGLNPVGAFFSDRPTVREALTRIARGRLRDPVVRPDGLITFVYLNDPTITSTSDSYYRGTIRQEDLRSELTVYDDRAPNLTTRATYGRNYAIHSDNEIAGSVSAANRALLVAPYSTAQVANGTVHSFYKHAEGAEPWEMYYPQDTDSTSSLSSYLTSKYTVKRRWFEFDVDAALVRRWVPGDVFKLIHSRFGLSAGKQIEVVHMVRRAKAPTVRMKCWG